MRHLLPYLREHCDVELWVEPGFETSAEEGADVYRSAAELDPRQFDQVLYQLGNERSHAYMPRMIRSIGGTVMQHDWVLFDLALAAFPALARGGAKGHALALREGGLGQAKLYNKNWLERRQQRLGGVEPILDYGALAGTVLAGWHGFEGRGRWTTDNAAFRLPARNVRSVTVEAVVEGERRVRLEYAGRTIANEGGGVLEATLKGVDEPVLVLVTEGITVTKEQRRHGDARRLGCFVSRIAWSDASGEHELDLEEAPAVMNRPVNLSRDRFDLPLNRSVVRFADAFIVHSRYLKERILRERNASTAVGILHHGSERRWRTDDRREMRRRLGLNDAWAQGFLVTSFGGVQPHKRIEKALEALAKARRERDDIRLVLAGSMHAEEFDPKATAKRLGVLDAVHMTGFVPEEVGWDWLHAGDVALNLRGPSSGGTSGGIFQAFSMSRAVIASDAYEQRELPDPCVLKIPSDEHESDTLARELVSLRDDPARRDALETAVRAFVDEECHWSIVAKQYADFLGQFPKPRVSRRKLVAMRLDLQR